MSLPAAVIQDQLAGASISRQDFVDSAEAINSVIKTLDELDWGRTGGDTLRQRLECGGTNTTDRLIEEPALSKIVSALVRYLHSFSTSPIDLFFSFCALRLIPAAGGQQLILTADMPAAAVRGGRMNYFLDTSFSLEELIEADHGFPSLLLFSPLGEIAMRGLSCTFSAGKNGRLVFLISG